MRLDSCYNKNIGEDKKKYPYICSACFTEQPDDKSTHHFRDSNCPVGKKEKLGEVLAYALRELIKELKC